MPVGLLTCDILEVCGRYYWPGPSGLWPSSKTANFIVSFLKLWSNLIIIQKSHFDLQFVHNLFWLKLKWNAISKLLYCIIYCSSMLWWSSRTLTKLKSQSSIIFCTKDKFKFGAKLISDNFYVSSPEWFLFLYFKYWYFHSLKHFWDCTKCLL
jgi:hypothetical protein